MNGFKPTCADFESGAESVLPNPYCRGFGNEARGAAVFRPNLQPAVPAANHVNLCSRFNIGNELGVCSGRAKDARWLNDFVAFRRR